jgi:hypothetical protein
MNFFGPYKAPGAGAGGETYRKRTTEYSRSIVIIPKISIATCNGLRSELNFKDLLSNPIDKRAY